MRFSFEKNHFYLTGAIAAFLPVFQNLVPITIAVLFLNWLVQGRFKTRFQQARNLRIAGLFGMFYLVHIIGMIYSENLQHGLFDLQVKLSFLILPIIYATSHRFTSRELHLIMRAFTLSVILAILYSLVDCHFEFIEHNNWLLYYGSNFSKHMHLGYFALHINLAIAFVLHELLFSNKATSFIMRLVLALALLLMMIAIFLSTSKIGLISLVLMLLGVLFFWTAKSKKWIHGILLLTLLFAGMATVYNTTARTATYQRFELALKNLFKSDLDKSSVESTTTRKFAWQAAWQVFSDNPILGVGTGDVKDCLVEQYEAMGYSGLVEKRFNPHNQFIQTAVALGLMGLTLLVLIVLNPLEWAIRQRNILMILLLFLFTLYAFTESVIERQAGVLFTVYFVSIFIWGENSK